ncbi:hypothetical protein OG749_39745 [Streptomyces nojiriensis]
MSQVLGGLLGVERLVVVDAGKHHGVLADVAESVVEKDNAR